MASTWRATSRPRSSFWSPGCYCCWRCGAGPARRRLRSRAPRRHRRPTHRPPSSSGCGTSSSSSPTSHAVIEFVIGVLLAAAAVWFVLQPIFRAELVGRGTREAASGGDGQDADDDLSPRAVALGALREIEFDRATGKLSDVDYDVLLRVRPQAGCGSRVLRSLRLGAGDGRALLPHLRRAHRRLRGSAPITVPDLRPGSRP